jgi:DNA polymerase elongation subunit (family B)
MSLANGALYTYYRQYGNKILFRYRKNGKSYSKQVDFYQPSLFTRCDNDEGDANSIYGFPLTRKTFNGIREAKDFASMYKDVEGFEIHGNSNYANQFIIELYEGKMPDFTPDMIRVGYLDIEVDSPNEFPEPSVAKWPINGITFYDTFTDTYYCFGDKPYIHNKQNEYVGDLKVEYMLCTDEIDLLNNMLNHFKTFNYDVTTGWNSEKFDIPYIIRRCYSLIGEDKTNNSISPFGIIKEKSGYDDFGQESVTFEIFGSPHIDYLELYKKHNFKSRESYKLDYIAHVELGKAKVSYEEAGTLSKLYHTDPQKFYEYNITDVRIIKDLDDKLGFLSITYIIAYYSLSNYVDTLGTVKMWEQLLAKHLYSTGKVPPFRRVANTKDEPFEGAFVHPTQVGYCQWVLSIDLNSLYPMNEIQYNIGPETYIPVDKLPPELKLLKSKYTLDDLVHKRVDLSVLQKYNVCMTGFFEFYRRDIKSCVAEIKDVLYSDRKMYKKRMLAAESVVEKLKAEKADQFELKKQESIAVLNNNIQQSLKIVLNGGYGAVANSSFLYYLLQNAASITLSGQLINKWTHVRVNHLLNELLGTDKSISRTVAGDTDSLYLCLDDVVKYMKIDHLSDDEIANKLDEFHKTILEPKIKEWCLELASYMNAVENKMVWEREVIASSAIYVAKKKYAMMVIDSEGVRYEKPKLKMVGLEAIKASAYPEWARGYLKKAYEVCLTKSEVDLQEYVSYVQSQFGKFAPSEIASPRGVNGLEKYSDPVAICTKGTPKHVRAALVHNWLVDKKGLTNIEKITSSSKIKYIELKMPNPINQPVVGFTTHLPPEFGLDQYVDRDSVFKSCFLQPLRLFLSAISWSDEPIISLDSFFG